MTLRKGGIIAFSVLTISLLWAGGGTSISGHNQGWLNIGPGIALGPKVGGFGYGVGISYYPGRYLISGRYIKIVDGLGAEPLVVDEEVESADYENMVDVGVCIGSILKSKWAFASGAGGLGIITGERRPVGSCSPERYMVLNVPLEAQIYMTPTPAFGVGITLIGNVNRLSTTFGMLVCLQYGLLW